MRMDNLTKEEKDRLDEIRQLSERADAESNSFNLFEAQELGDEDIDNGFDFSAIKDSTNPNKAHTLYYGIMSLLRKNLPKGVGANKRLRQEIYDEKNLFLNRGKQKDINGIRHSDGRMTYISFLEIAFEKVSMWVTAGANPFDVFMVFWDLNKEYQFRSSSTEPTPLNIPE